MGAPNYSRWAAFTWTSLAALAWACGGSGAAPGSSSGTGGAAAKIDCGKDLELCGALCVDTKSDGKNCGSCGKTCDKATACVAGKCSVSCPGSLTVCGNDCIDVMDDPAHCGSCDKTCAAPMGGESLCLMGQCGFLCKAGLDDCNGKADDGCETPLATTKQNCGACGKKCPTVVNGEVGCTDSKCVVASCGMGFDNCDSDVTTGCEAKLDSDKKNCGKCGKVCMANENCFSGMCQTGVLIKVFGHADVFAACQPGDYSCQAKAVCEKVTNLQCIFQQYDCYFGNTGSWYPNDGVSGSSNFNFAYGYDTSPGGWGNICSCNSSQLQKYGLGVKFPQPCGIGSGQWIRQ